MEFQKEIGGRMPAALFFAGDTKSLQRAIIFAVRNKN
jgi:hypothetical protein